MSNTIIKDGNTGQTVRVLPDSENQGRLLTRGAVEGLEIVECTVGNSFTFFHTMVQTNANIEALLYIKNTREIDLLIHKLTWFVGTSTGGTGDALIWLNTNKDDGSIVSSSLPISRIGSNNFNLVGEETFQGIAYGGNGIGNLTLTTDPIPGVPFPVQQNQGKVEYNTQLLLPVGKSIVLGWQSPVGNSSQRITVALQAYYRP